LRRQNSQWSLALFHTSFRLPYCALWSDGTR
jgi:hypothetical protein